MVIVSSYNELKNVQTAIEKLNASIYQKFINIIKLTRQFHYGYQYMGSLIMDEDPNQFQPMSQDDYVLSVYKKEIDKLKTDNKFLDLKQLLKSHQQLGYVNISKLALGENPQALVGPMVLR
ncbi:MULTISPECIES: hypothetical protein [Neobacillus]|uniref:Uncharacterized protein n=1 Tax=Neobacillus rhizophilus TaxID=2833579 RepID=A0A942U5Q4_9BACI|nr:MULTISPECIES: hypothetical protein [Neobacillus]MBS4212927.1 hypothetical protein [Neobacillus rhizophilus]MBU8918143.1 hypothetical protein [Bacillus sp. FJAT-29953]